MTSKRHHTDSVPPEAPIDLLAPMPGEIERDLGDLDFGASNGGAAKADNLAELTAMLVTTTRTPHFNRGGFRFTKTPTLVRRADVGEDRWAEILREGNRFLTVSPIDEDQAKHFELTNRAAPPAASDLAALRAENIRQKDEIDTLRKDLALARSTKRRRI